MKSFNLLRVAALSAAVTLTVMDASAFAETATNVFARHFAAAGGLDEYQKIETVVVRGTGREREDTFKFELSQKKPGCILLVISSGSQVIARIGRDNQAHFWQENRDLGIGDLPKERQGEVMDLAIGLFPPSVCYFSTVLGQAVCKEVPGDNGRTFVVLGDETRNTAFPHLVFDKTSGLLARISGVEVGDYRAVNKIKLPFKIKPDERSEFQVEEVELNAPLDDKIFAKPGQAMASIASKGPDEYPTLISHSGKMEIVRKPAPMQFGRGKIKSIPSFNPASTQPGQVDLRSCDLRDMDLSPCTENLLHADFDTATKWPATMPAGFDHDKIMVLGKDPGLAVRKLHERGIEGKGIGIGIIDQSLLVDHVEYSDRLKLYEEIHNPSSVAQMHGPAVASIAVGKTVGVASKADLYYIAETHGVFKTQGQFDWDFTWLAKSIDRLLEVNSTLPADRKIRVISISVGWSPEQKGFKEAMAAVERATKANVFVVSTAIEATHKLAFHGLGRGGLTDPNDFNSYAPGSWWSTMFWSGQMRFQPGARLLIPMDARTTASPTGSGDYVFYSSGGWSWSVPWISGLYALACEVKPEITPQEFWSQALKTGRTITLHHDGKDIPFGTIADPVALIDSLSEKR